MENMTVSKLVKTTGKPDALKGACPVWRGAVENPGHAGRWPPTRPVVHTIFFKPLYVLVFMKHETREVVHTAVTNHPTDAWTAQQVESGDQTVAAQANANQPQTAPVDIAMEEGLRSLLWLRPQLLAMRKSRPSRVAWLETG